MMREVVLCGGNHDHTNGISGSTDGMVRLLYRPLRVQDIFASMLAERAYEACEFSLANYLILRATGQDWLTALAVFPYRAFRHGLVVVKRASPLTDLAQLAGCRIALEDYSMTAAVWLRGLLRADYRVDHRSITWVTPHTQRLPIPPGACVEHTDADLETLLEQGSVDAMLAFALRDSRRVPQERRLRTLLVEPARLERDYYARTGIFPINHCVVVRNDALVELPHLPRLIASAYAEAKARAYARRAASVLPWGGSRWEEDMAGFGGDPLPFGMTAVNRRVVATLAEDLREQGFIARLPPLEALFIA